MGKKILYFLLKGRFIFFRAFKNGKWQALIFSFRKTLDALWRVYYSRAGNKISTKGRWKLESSGIYLRINLTELIVIWVWG